MTEDKITFEGLFLVDKTVRSFKELKTTAYRTIVVIKMTSYLSLLPKDILISHALFRRKFSTKYLALGKYWHLLGSRAA
jgi:hypothetical protein